MRTCWMLALVGACTGVGGKTGETGDTGSPGTAPVDDWQPQSRIDVGTVCFEDRDTDVAVRVDPQDCLSSSCSRAFQGTCTATLTGTTTITVTSDISWEQNQGENVACTDDCGSTAVECTLPDLADGTYTVDF